jgi:glycosyltransferase involved in cell wall biosynthesis
MSTNPDPLLTNKPKYLVSVVVPIFNMEGKLSNLFSWLPEANALGFQVILVCNCCIDGTRRELEDFTQTQNLGNVSIFECNEPGPGNARNFGKKLVSGEFILFWDSDDVGYPKAVQEILEKTQDFDLLLASSLTEPPTLISRLELGTSEINKLDEFSLNPGLWRCIFRANSIKSIKFGESRMGEDQVFLARVLATSPDIESNPGVIYKYLMNVPNQLTSKKENIAGLVSSVNLTKHLIYSTPNKYKIVTTVFTLRMLLTGIKMGTFDVKMRMAVITINFLLLLRIENVSRRKRFNSLLGIIRNRKYV